MIMIVIVIVIVIVIFMADVIRIQTPFQPRPAANPLPPLPLPPLPLPPLPLLPLLAGRALTDKEM